MKLTEEQIWKCNQTINYKNGEVVDAVHICLDHQNVVDFARSIEREIGFAKAELWIKRINDAVLAEREACAKVCEELVAPEIYSDTDVSMWDVTCLDCAEAILARGQTSCTHEWMDDTKDKPQWRCAKCNCEYTKGQL